MRRHVRWFIALTLLLPVNLGAQQNATVQGSVVDASQGALPGTTGSHGDRNVTRHSDHGHDGPGRALRVRQPRSGLLQVPRRAPGIRHGGISRRRTARRTERHPSGDDDESGGHGGDGHRDAAGAARRRHARRGGGQHRSPPDGGAAAARAQLGRIVDDGQGHNCEQRHEHAGGKR